ncbi:RIB43A-like with coiled-coils protein 2 [Bradysia coprophila]|uniref:RIB43A-like with coiled-coils protein 2 n=1 Tax=Bradysia coprophila TaxID=38358 RepID=UPI00187DD8DA|nr:RIB43A-like with coiled-coils protein 2 [Bradysia coprophila]
MEKFQVATKADLKQAAIIEHKRRYEEERKSRIFNARNRIIGVDQDGLNRQILEKKFIREQELERERCFREEEERRTEVLNKKHEELAKERHRIQSEINNYRITHQRKDLAREFDLNDPKYIQKSAPARISDNDERLSVSGAQLFVGEDLSNSDRQRLQRDQQKLWLDHQMKEKAQADYDRIQREKNIQAAMFAYDQRAKELDDTERENRRKLLAANAKYNLELASERESKRIQEQREQEEDNLAEMFNLLSSDMLTENKSSANSNFGINRKITANYRGMTDEELDEIIRTQKVQQIELNRKRDEDEITQSQWQQQTNNLARITELKEREIERARRTLNQKLQTENRQMADEQKCYQDYMNKVVFTNSPTSEYFNQFNTSSR